MHEHREYRVTLNLVKQATYVVSARTPEEAESIVEDMVAEGEEPLAEELVDLAFEDVLPLEADEATSVLDEFESYN